MNVGQKDRLPNQSGSIVHLSREDRPVWRCSHEVRHSLASQRQAHLRRRIEFVGNLAQDVEWEIRELGDLLADIGLS